MEHPPAVVSVDDKGMAVWPVFPSHQNGSFLVQFFPNHFAPFQSGIVESEGDTGGLRITELIAQSFGSVLGFRPRAFAIVHPDSLPAVAHQSGHRLLLLLRTRAFLGVGWQHLVPLKGGGWQSLHLNGLFGLFVCVCVCVSGNVGGDRLGPLVVVHHLSHSRSHTACYGLETVDDRSLQVIGRFLSPAGLNEWFDGSHTGVAVSR